MDDDDCGDEHCRGPTALVRCELALTTHSCHSPFSNCRLGADVRPCDTTHGMARLGLGWMSSCTRVHVSDRDFDVLRQ